MNFTVKASYDGAFMHQPSPSPAGAAAASAAPPAKAGGNVRWVVCALLFFAATINYVDRQVIGILKPTLQQEFGWSEIDYADIVFAFQLAYAIGLLLAGPIMDRIGARRGFIVAITVWSLAAILHAEATVIGGPTATILAAFGLTYTVSVAGFIGARFLLGLGEAGNFPRGNQGRSRSGFRSGSAPSPPGCSIPAPTSARC